MRFCTFSRQHFSCLLKGAQDNRWKIPCKKETDTQNRQLPALHNEVFPPGHNAFLGLNRSNQVPVFLVKSFYVLVFFLIWCMFFNDLQIPTSVQVILAKTTEPALIKWQITYVTVLQDIRERTAAWVRNN